MNKSTLALLMLALFAFCSCSDDKDDQVTEATAQQVLDHMRGIYEGRVSLESSYHDVTITVGDDFQVSKLPLQPILELLVDDRAELSALLSSTPGVATFTAPIRSLSISPSQSVLVMEPTDLVFTIPIDGTQVQVSAMIESSALWDSQTHTLSVSMELTELLCQGRSYDFSLRRVSYYIDNARKM